MVVALDSCSLQHALRGLKSKNQNNIPRVETPFDPFIEKKSLCFVLDVEHGLSSEWGRTCGQELVRQLINYWQTKGAILPVSCKNLPKIDQTISKKLRQFGMKRSTIDKLLLRLGLYIPGRIIVSDDSDFWDPKNLASKGKQNAAVCKYCNDYLDISVFLLADLFQQLKRSVL